MKRNDASEESVGKTLPASTETFGVRNEFQKPLPTGGLN
jgi:hypothetical protein